MGADIHWFVEIKTEQGWKYVEPPEIEKDCIYEDRNYPLFALLVGIRNMAGVVPMGPERGIPDDVSGAISECVDGYDHSHSWYTVAELTGVDWDQTICGGRKTLADRCKHFLTRTLPALQELASRVGGPEMVRVVFWFDS
jgi:hypothetical protein